MLSLLDLIKANLVRTDAQAERFAEVLIENWHTDKIAGELYALIGVNHREYQAWKTGNVSLLTIARWQKNGYPPLDPDRPWFKLSGSPGSEKVGYLEDKPVRRVAPGRKPQTKRVAKVQPLRK